MLPKDVRKHRKRLGSQLLGVSSIPVERRDSQTGCWCFRTHVLQKLPSLFTFHHPESQGDPAWVRQPHLTRTTWIRQRFPQGPPHTVSHGHFLPCTQLKLGQLYAETTCGSFERKSPDIIPTKGSIQYSALQGYWKAQECLEWWLWPQEKPQQPSLRPSHTQQQPCNTV